MIKRHTINFSKYLSVGIFVNFLNIFFSWVFIDIVGMMALVSSTIIGISIFFIKYFSYTKIKLIHKKFVIFMFISISSMIAYIILSTLLIDFLLVPTLIAIPSIVIFLFLVRFVSFYWTRIIRN